MSVVGFDVGYQSAYVAIARQGGIETAANEYSDRCTPVCVSLRERNRFMGTAAKQQMVANLKNTIWGWKKFIGRRFDDPQVQRERHLLPYEVVEGQNGMAAFKVQYLNETHIFTPEQVNAMMLTKLREISESNLKTKVVDCVLSVPCYFTDTERRAMLDSASMAGLNCLRLMNDTTATALAYGIYKQDLPVPEEKPRNVIFIDLGHSDLQISACAFHKGKLKVLATAAHPSLGGIDFDRLIADHFAVEFLKRFKVDANTKPKAYCRLLQESEKLKKLMSANMTEIPLNIECFMDDKDVHGKMKRADFEELAASLFEQIESTFRDILSATNLKSDDIHSVEIVGGSTRIPAVKAMVSKVFGKEPSTTLNTDEAISRGCALQCAILSPTLRVRDFSITDCQAFPITLSWQAGLEDVESEMEVFPVHHQTPFSKMLTFYRKEPFTLEAKYTTSNIPYPSQNIGAFYIDKVQPQANGESLKVKVKVRVNIHGVFTVAGASMVEKIEVAEEEEEEKEKDKKKKKEKEEPMEQEADNGPKKEAKAEGEATTNGPETPAEPMETDQAEVKTETSEENKENGGDKKESPKKPKTKVKTVDLPITCKVPQLSQKEIDGLFEKEAQMIMQDKIEKERADAKNAVEEYVYEMRDKLFGVLEKFVKEEDQSTLSLLLEDTENWLYDEGEDQVKSVYVEKLVQIRKLSQPIINRHLECEQRPPVFESFGAALQRIRKAVDLYEAKDEKYDHLDQGEMDKVAKCLIEKATWFEKHIQTCASLQPYDNPPVTCQQIRTEHQTLETTCHPVLNKPKPKPKEEPPKEEPKPAATEGAEDKGKGDEVEAEEGADKDKTEAAATTDEVKPEMELD